MRKVLSFVLVLALVLSSFSMAFAADTTVSSLSDIAGNANEDAIQVAFDLGIVTGNPDGTFLPEKAVTRAEFAAMLTRALDIPDSALAGYTATTFKDTAGYSWAVPYLAFCQSKGILLGDGAGNVMPGNTITVNEAMTMALRAIGYTANSSLLVGAWPSNYVSLAQNNDLYDDVAKTTSVNKASAAQIIYNLLTVQKVAVNSDGTTDILWVDGDEDEGVLNLLNSNLGCESEDGVIMGYDYSYDDAIINITDDIGAYGTVYTNDDEDIVAFIRDDCATITGSVNDDGDFEVGDVTYEFGDDITSAGIVFLNTDDLHTGVTLDADEIQDIADGTAYSNILSDDGDTVTLNVELSGKKIKEVYSVSVWSASDDFEADSDVQDEITDDHELNSNVFVEDDDDNIDGNSFELVGVASLDKIAEDNVVYVYCDDDGDIRKVAVGTETVEGTIDEINDDYDVLTIADKDYDVAYLGNDVTYDFDDNDVSGDGTFYLDGYGQIYDYDGSSTTDTYGVVKASTAPDSYDNLKIKLYKSDDSTSTVYLNEEDPADIDWETDSASALVGPENVSAPALIGYSLDSNGDIDAIDNTMIVNDTSLTFKSTKVLGGKSIDADCAVFTYSGTWDGDVDGTVSSITDFDVASLGDIDAGTDIADATHAVAYILNDDDDVVAMLVSDTFADATDDDIYGVINSRKSTTDDGGDNVYKFTGYIDGTSFTYKTDDNTGFNGFTSKFGIYAITLDTDSLITEIKALDLDGVGDNGTVDGSDEGTSSIGDEVSYLIMESGGAEVVTGLDDDNTVITTDDNNTPSVTTDDETYTVADDAVVYKYDEDDEEYTVSKLSAIDENDLVSLYDTKGEDIDGIATVVIYIEDYVD